MRDWYAVAKVRTGAPVDLRGGEGLPFSPALLPHAHLHAAADPDQRHELLRRALARYLDATCALELVLVNPVVGAIAAGSAPLSFDDHARLDAHRIYCDEGYHALQAAELRAQIAADLPRREPPFAARLDEVAARGGATEADRPLVALLFAVVTETLLSANLRTLSSDPRLLPAVRSFVADHAVDEAWHGTCFGAWFAEAHRQIAPADRDRLFPLLPELICAFLAPDAGAIAEDLAAVGLSAPAPPFPHPTPHPGLRTAAQPTIAAVARAGAMQGATARAFARAGLVEG